MKRAIFTSALVALLFSACSKKDAMADVAATPAAQRPTGDAVQGTQSGAWATGWETPASWSSAAGNPNFTIFSAPRYFKQLDQGMLNNGAVLVFAKGYNFGDPGMDRPMGLPFHFFLPYERVNFPVLWRYLAKNYGIDLDLEMHNGQSKYFYGAQPNVQVRYFLIPPAALGELNMTVADVRNMSYTDLVQKLGVTP